MKVLWLKATMVTSIKVNDLFTYPWLVWIRLQSVRNSGQVINEFILYLIIQSFHQKSINMCLLWYNMVVGHIFCAHCTRQTYCNSHSISNWTKAKRWHLASNRLVKFICRLAMFVNFSWLVVAKVLSTWPGIMSMNRIWATCKIMSNSHWMAAVETWWKTWMMTMVMTTMMMTMTKRLLECFWAGFYCRVELFIFEYWV